MILVFDRRLRMALAKVSAGSRMEEARFLAGRPSSGHGGTDQGSAFDAHDGGDQRRPLVILETL